MMKLNKFFIIIIYFSFLYSAEEDYTAIGVMEKVMTFIYIYPVIYLMNGEWKKQQLLCIYYIFCIIPATSTFRFF